MSGNVRPGTRVPAHFTDRREARMSVPERESFGNMRGRSAMAARELPGSARGGYDLRRDFSGAILQQVPRSAYTSVITPSSSFTDMTVPRMFSVSEPGINLGRSYLEYEPPVVVTRPIQNIVVVPRKTCCDRFLRFLKIIFCWFK